MEEGDWVEGFALGVLVRGELGCVGGGGLGEGVLQSGTSWWLGWNCSVVDVVEVR